MNEAEYDVKIDVSFPYDDEEAWKAAIDEGIGISDNGAYAALHELCGAPPEIQQTDLMRMLEYWASRYEHPTKPVMMIAAQAVIRGEALTEQEVLKYLDEVARYPGLYAAAGILWWAGPREEGSPRRSTDRIEQKCREIRNRWAALDLSSIRGGQCLLRQVCQGIWSLPRRHAGTLFSCRDGRDGV